MEEEREELKLLEGEAFEMRNMGLPFPTASSTTLCHLLYTDDHRLLPFDVRGGGGGGKKDPAIRGKAETRHRDGPLL